MKRLIAALMAMFSAAPVHGVDTVRIIVDDQHLQLERLGKPKPVMYELVAAKQVEIDASDYEFRLPEKLKGQRLNSVQFAFGKQKAYSANWPESDKRIVLSKRNLVPSPESVPFSGIRSGDSGVIAIGILEGSSFFVVWVGMFRVQ